MTNLERMVAKMPENADAVLVTSAENRFFVSGMRSSDGVCLVFRDAAYFIIDFRYIEKARATVKDLTVMLQEKRSEQLTALLRQHNAETVAIEEGCVTVAEAKKLSEQLAPVRVVTDAGVTEVFERLRAIKTPEELAHIKTAQEYTDAGFAHICKFIRAGRTEREVALELEFYMRKLGSEGAAFEFIAVSGPNSSLPHGKPGARELRSGDFLTMDYGGISGGYLSDMTRTVGIGTLEGEQLRVYDIVFNAHIAAFEAARPGMKCKDYDAVARDIITDAGYGECFGHSIGHAVGLEIHEWPYCGKNADAELAPGMVVTDEPGIYLEGRFGVRIENMLYITENGAENLTMSPRELILL